ncbi:MAG: 3'-5' exonuclease, partial [Thermoplasmata archaeon]
VGKHPESSLFAVGDPRQSIYQWRGGDVSRILKFTQDFPQTECFNLSVNHRSRTGIVRFANIVAADMAFDSDFESEDMEPSPERSDARVSVLNDISSNDHEARVVQTITKLHSDGVDYSSMAILLRSVIYHGQNLMQMLDDEGVPYFSPNRNSGTALVEELMLSVIQLIRIMSEDPISRSREEEEELIEEIGKHLANIEKYCGEKDTGSIHLAVSDWLERLSNPVLVEGRDHQAVYANEAYNFRRQFFDFCDSVDFRIQPDEIELQEGFSAITQIMRAVEEVYRRRFQGLGYVRPSPVEVLTRNIAWQLSHQIERWTEVGMDFTRQDRLVLSTVHAAKGLQWPVVFAPFLWTGTFPLNERGHDTSFDDEVASRYGTAREDEKRLWYVAATRARDRLYLFSGCDENQHPSPFTHQDKLSEHTDVIATITSQQDADVVELSNVVSHSEETYSHVGVSDLLLLLECPYHFHLRCTKGVNVPVGEELGAGDILHKVIERISLSETLPSVDDILNEEVYLPLAEFSLQEKVKKSIKKKVNRLVESGILEDVDHAEYPFTLGIHNLVVSGIVDATRLIGEGLEIIDWKSSVHPEFLHRYENQVMIYAHALRTLGLDVVSGMIYDLSKDDVRQSAINVDVSEASVKTLMERLEQEVGALLEAAPSPKPSENVCRICDVKEVCPSRFREGLEQEQAKTGQR